jgi:lactate 2-monooxygenase
MEEIAREMGDAPRWFQLYWSTSDELVESLLARAERSGYSAIVVTLDTTLLGWRPMDLDAAYLPFLEGKGIAQYTSDPAFRAALDEPLPQTDAPRPPLRPRLFRTLLRVLRSFPGGARQGLRGGRARKAVQRFIATYSRPSLTWDDLAFLRERTKLPIVLKGILHPADARRALEHEVDAIWVSNHGGRQVDGAISPIEALPDVVSAVEGRLPVLMDGGVRGGADMIKARALGAHLVGIGRPYAYGLALAGERGVQEVIRNMKADLDLTMGLCGMSAISDITTEVLA